jgi:hypothetical protein
MLTNERVAAMRLLTNKMKRVAKVPVVMENKFCSHLDLDTSAVLIEANELAKLQKSGKFNKIWEDREH